MFRTRLSKWAIKATDTAVYVGFGYLLADKIFG